MNLKTFYEKRYDKSLQAKTTTTKESNYILANEIKNPKDKHILEVGPGLGAVLRRYEKHNKLYSLDLSEDVLKLLKTFSTAKKCDVSSDVYPFKDNSFDIVICSEIIEHVFDGQHMVNEIYRVLKPKGKLYIQTHNSFNILMRLRYLFGMIPTESLDITGNSQGEHIRIFNHKNLKKILLRAGFKNKNIKDESWTGAGKYLYKVRIFKSLLTRHLFYVAKK